MDGKDGKKKQIKIEYDGEPIEIKYGEETYILTDNGPMFTNEKTKMAYLDTPSGKFGYISITFKGRALVLILEKKDD